MKTKTISPKITSLHWGEVNVDSTKYKDAKLFPGGSRKWDWNETGTRHSPGIQSADIKELLEHDAQVIILSEGINKRLKTSDEAKAYLEERGIKYFILQTEEAVGKYNQLREEMPVGALIHSTC